MKKSWKEKYITAKETILFMFAVCVAEVFHYLEQKK
jgi:hypothetical protein